MRTIDGVLGNELSKGTLNEFKANFYVLMKELEQGTFDQPSVSLARQLKNNLTLGVFRRFCCMISSAQKTTRIIAEFVKPQKEYVLNYNPRRFQAPSEVSFVQAREPQLVVANVPHSGDMQEVDLHRSIPGFDG